MNDVNCPYCGAGQEIDHDDGYGYEEDTLYQQVCSECEKTFAYTTSKRYYYDATEAPCLNGAEHKWRPIIGAPTYYFVGRFRCEYCNEEKKDDGWTEDRWKEMIKQRLNI